LTISAFQATEAAFRVKNEADSLRAAAASNATPEMESKMEDHGRDLEH
jgi:hypothetical protein